VRAPTDLREVTVGAGHVLGQRVGIREDDVQHDWPQGGIIFFAQHRADHWLEHSP
jgi:hypothetical protein